MAITRREFLKAGTVLVVSTGLTCMGIRGVEAKQILDDDKKEVNKTEFESKAEYVKYIEPIKNKYRKIIEQNDILEDYKSLSQEERLKAFDMYFPMYYAAQLKYQVLWELLFLTHAHETTFSMNSNPDGNLFLGSMQRSPKYFPESYVIEASKGWLFLADLPQRYTKGGGISDTSD